MQGVEAIIQLIIDCLSEVNDYVLKTGFKDINEEIRFFKYQKPAIVTKLIYYNAIYKIETKKPNEAKSIKEYLNKELKKLKRYFDIILNFTNTTAPTIPILTTDISSGTNMILSWGLIPTIFRPTIVFLLLTITRLP